MHGVNTRVPRLSDIAAKAFGPPAHAVTFGERGDSAVGRNDCGKATFHSRKAICR